MKIYKYTSINGKIVDAKFKFCPSIFHAVKLETGKNLEMVLQNDPYNEQVLGICLNKFHLKALEEDKSGGAYSRAELVSGLDVDEMLLIYTTLSIERQSFLKSGLKL